MDFRFFCPFCGEKLKADVEHAGHKADCVHCGKEFAIPEPEKASPPATPAPPPKETPRKPAANLNGALACPLCWLRFDKGEVTDGACPHCQRKLPAGFPDLPHPVISVVGDQGAGKAYFLSVLTQVLPVAMRREFGITIQDSDAAANAPINDLRQALFEGKTSAQVKPARAAFTEAMYEKLTHQGPSVAFPRPFAYTLTPADKLREKSALVFYDNAGEHFQPGVNMEEHPGAQHLAGATGIIYLFDPFNSPKFRDLLKGTKDPQMEKNVVDRHESILAEMQDRLQTLRKLPKGEKMNTPVAFVLAKSDAWLHLLEGTPIFDPLQEGLLEQATITKNSEALRQFLQRLCPAVVTQAENLSTNVKFFAASAFGQAPAKTGPGEYVPDPAKLQPQQVEIPLLWILTQTCPGLFRGTPTVPSLKGQLK